MEEPGILFHGLVGRMVEKEPLDALINGSGDIIQVR